MGYHDGAEEGEEREGAASLENASNDDKIYGANASGQGNTTTNTKANSKDNDDKEGRMAVIPQFWVCAMEHIEAVDKLITERDIDYLKHITDVNCQ